MKVIKISNKNRIIIKLIVFIIIFMAILFLCMLQLYPRKYKDFISHYSEKYSLEEELVYAVIRSESRFNEKAVSSKGAVGLMQLMPETAEWIASENNIDYSHKKLYLAEYNIMIGCLYLSYLKTQNGDDISVLLASYNAGEGRVRQWIKSGEVLLENGELKQIPFKETKDYIKRTILSYKIYKLLY